MKFINRFILTVLGVILSGLAFLFFAPGYNLYLVRSESMSPTIDMGDLIVTGPVNSRLGGAVEEGKIITYEYKNELITHRVWSIDGTTLVTKGDATEDPDPWSFTLSDVVGIYLFKIPYVGYMTSFIRTKLGWFLMIIVPAAFLVGWLVKDILKEAFNDA